MEEKSMSNDEFNQKRPLGFGGFFARQVKIIED